MKIKIDSYIAKTKLPELLRLVKAGQSFMTTNLVQPLMPQTTRQ
jgi:hypothetical protein